MSRRRAGNLPAELTPFVGRENVLAVVAQRFADGARLVTLTGPSGVGKTRVAVKVGERAREHPDFLHGVWMVSLAGLHETELVDRAVAAALGVVDNTRGESGLARLVEALRDRNVLLILDNCEHLLPAVRRLTQAVLQGCPDVAILTTSQERLRVPGEHIMRVPPMSLGEEMAERPASVARAGEAVRLFIDRAAAVGVEIGEGERHDAAELCEVLDGLPLAIELAAVRLGELSLAEILEQLTDDSRFTLLVDGDPSGKSAHRTLRRALEWSATRCSLDEQRLWARLSVFPADCDRESIEAVCSGDGIEPNEVLDLITGLVRKSILIAEVSQVARRTRYRMLDSVRLFGAQMLAEGDRARLRQAHADHYWDRVAQGTQDWFSPREVKWMRVLNEEWPNIRSALTFYLAHAEESQVLRGAELAVNCSRTRFGTFSGMLGQQRHMLEQAYRVLAPTAHPVLLDVAVHIAWLSLIQGEVQVAGPFLKHARAAADQLGLREVSPGLLYVEGTYNLWAERDPALAGRSYGQFVRAAEIARRAGFSNDASMMDLFAALAACLYGDRETAHQAVTDLVATTEAHRAEWSISWALWANALFILLQGGDPAEAYRLVQSALAKQRQMGDRWGPGWSLFLLACLATKLGLFALAARLFGGARTQKQAVHVTMAGLRPLARMKEHAQHEARRVLGVGEFDAEVAIGAGMRLEQIVDMAMAPLPDDHKTPGGDAMDSAVQRRGGLSPREFEIAGLVAAGKSSKEIARLLTLSARTVDRHVENIRSKLALPRRTAVADWYRHHAEDGGEHSTTS